MEGILSSSYVDKRYGKKLPTAEDVSRCRDYIGLIWLINERRQKHSPLVCNVLFSFVFKSLRIEDVCMFVI